MKNKNKCIVKVKKDRVCKICGEKIKKGTQCVTINPSDEMEVKTYVLLTNISLLIATVFLICHFNDWKWILFYFLCQIGIEYKK